MNDREILEEIIKQGGKCFGIKCAADKCPLDNDRYECDVLRFREKLEEAKRMLEELDNKEKSVCKFKAGDLVFCLMHGWGVILHIYSRDNHPLYVQFAECTCSFTFQGRYYDADTHPTLFTREEAAIKFPEYPAPKQKVKKTLTVWNVLYDTGLTLTFTSKPTPEKRIFSCKEVTHEWEEEI